MIGTNVTSILALGLTGLPAELRRIPFAVHDDCGLLWTGGSCECGRPPSGQCR